MPVVFSFLTWSLRSCPEPEQSWPFLNRLGLFQGGLITFPKINRKPNNSKRKETCQAPGTTLRGRAALQVPLLSCDLVIVWVLPGDSRGGILGPWGNLMWPRAALQGPLSSRGLVNDGAHPGGSRQEHTGHTKHPLPTTQKKPLYMDITRWSTLKSDWLYSL